jgi:hypothetical protein
MNKLQRLFSRNPPAPEHTGDVLQHRVGDKELANQQGRMHRCAIVVTASQEPVLPLRTLALLRVSNVHIDTIGY